MDVECQALFVSCNAAACRDPSPSPANSCTSQCSWIRPHGNSPALFQHAMNFWNIVSNQCVQTED